MWSGDHVKFDVILTNPPFQDSVGRGKTPHKLWIDFTLMVFEDLLKQGGTICQVSPASFRSPSNKILSLMKMNQTEYISLDTDKYFPGVGSTFSDYAIRKASNDGFATEIIANNGSDEIILDSSVFYLPNDFCATSLSIHKKVIFTTNAKLDVRWDYVTCHNIRLHRDKSVSKERTATNIYPIFHTNRQQWWSSSRQSWADQQKVMWTRSGYTRPFFDNGELGGTDMVYYVPVASADEGSALATNLNLSLFRYIFETARWSGFGNERVFAALPNIPTTELSDSELFSLFSLNQTEIDYVNASLE